MKKTLFVLWVFGMNQLAWADAAIAEGKDGKFYAAWGHTNTRIAEQRVINYCRNETGQACRAIFKIRGSGYYALAESPSRVGYGLSSNQADADQRALAECAKNTPESQTCTIVLRFNDQGSSYNAPAARCINPATGLPMVSGECWGVDVAGNPYGMRNN